MNVVQNLIKNNFSEVVLVWLKKVNILTYVTAI